MKTEQELNKSILKITLEIRNKHPELSDFLNEMPVTIPNAENPHINTKILSDYYESLYTLLHQYLKSTEK